MDALVLITVDAKPREITHRLEENRDRADVLAKRAVVLENHGQNDADRIINQIADNEQQKHRVLGGFSEMEQQEDERERKRKHDVSDESNLFSRALWLLVGEQIKNHRRPTGIAAPTPTKKQRSENLRNGIMQNTSTNNTGKQIIPETFYLHVFLAYQPEENKHVGTDAKLDELPGMFPSRP